MLINVISCVAITCIIVHSELFSWLRTLAYKIHDKLGYWFSCPMCFGFWAGIIFGLTVGVNPFIMGLLSSVSSWTTYNIVTAFGAVGDYYTTLLQNGEDNE